MLSGMANETGVRTIAEVAADFAIEVERCAKLKAAAAEATTRLAACEQRVVDLSEQLEQKRIELLGLDR